MPKKKTGIVDIPCFKCKKEIKDVPIVEGTKVKCPHCRHEFVITEESVTEIIRQTTISSYGKLPK